MKIEICEQLISSWLKNIKNCQIVQTNWSPSTNFKIADEDFKLYSNFLTEVKELTNDIDIFKKSNDSQFIKQAEIDVVGIKLTNGKVDELYLIDSAFHQAGLGYSDNAARIPKKLIRAIGVAELYFKGIPANIMFVSPFARASVENEIQAQLKKINGKINDLYSNMNVSVILNKEFVDQIYEPIISSIDSINDDNDLFIRCTKIMNLCEIEKVNKGISKQCFDEPNSSEHKHNRNNNETYIFHVLNALKDNGKLTDELLNNLESEGFTNRMFKMPTYPFLIKNGDFQKSLYANNTERFYKKPFEYNGVRYYVCSQWISSRVDLLKKWFNELIN